VDGCIEILGQHSDFDTALNEIQHHFSRPVTYEAIRGAMKRHGVPGTVGTYLKNPSPELKQKCDCRKCDGLDDVPQIAEQAITRNDPKVDGEVKTLIISDLHIPCHNHELVRRAINEGGDQLIVNGDMFDMAQVSTFGRESDGAFSDEYMRGLDMVTEWSTKFHSVYLTWGNHDFRSTKLLRKRVDPGLHFCFTDVLECLAMGVQLTAGGQRSGFRTLANVYYRPGPDGWWVRVGDAVVAHPRTFRKKECSTAHLTYDFFEPRIEHLRAAIIGHTHKLCRQIIENPEGERLVMECGCLCNEMGYTKEGVLNYAPKAQPGYGVLYQENGYTDFNRTRFVAL
jgi:predicted phosphodiesterase